MGSIEFRDEKLADATEAWLEAIGATDLSEETRVVLTDTFRAGWEDAMQANMTPAIELCLLFLRIASIERVGAEGVEKKVVLGPAVIDALVAKCKAVVGDVDMASLAAHVELVEFDPQ